MQERLENRLREIVAGIAGLEPGRIDRRQPLLRGGLELGSLTVASLVAAIEKEYQVDILEEDLTLASLESLAALADYIGERIRH
jgi:acyl carrier protein